MKALLFLLGIVVYAQPVVIAAGSPSDQYFTGGIGAWPVPLAAPLNFLRFSQPPSNSFKYDIPVPGTPEHPILYDLIFMLVEPNRTAPQQRLFTISANGQPSAPIDIFASVRADNVVFAFGMKALVWDGFLHLQFKALVGNAVVSQIVITQVPYILQCTCVTP